MIFPWRTVSADVFRFINLWSFILSEKTDIIIKMLYTLKPQNVLDFSEANIICCPKIYLVIMSE